MDPTDDLPTRAELAKELLRLRMRQMSEDFRAAGWLTRLEFSIWNMAHQSPHKFEGAPVPDDLAKSFRDLATVAEGWWVWPDTIGQKGDREIFIPHGEWKQHLSRGT